MQETLVVIAVVVPGILDIQLMMPAAEAEPAAGGLVRREWEAVTSGLELELVVYWDICSGPGIILVVMLDNRTEPTLIIIPFSNHENKLDNISVIS